MKKLSVLVSSMFILFGFTYADTQQFIVEVNNQDIIVNEAIDLTIKAVDDQGTVDTEYVSEGVYLEIAGGEDSGMGEEEKNWELENDFLEFSVEDQGIKRISKDLKFTKEGTYKIKVADFQDEAIAGELTVTVKGSGSQGSDGTIEVLSPQNGVSEKGDSLNIIGTTNMTNSSIEIYIDGQKLKTGNSDENGDINITIDKLAPGEHKLQLKVLDLEEKVAAESNEIPFTMIEDDTNFFKSISILPSNTVYKGEQFIITLNTLEGVSSAELEVEGIGSFPMDLVKAGEFKKNILIEKSGTYPVGAKLVAQGNSKEYKNIEKLTVVEKIGIINLKYQKILTGQIDLSWEFTGTVSKFRVVYGTGKENMNLSSITTVPNGIINDVNDIDTYFVQVFPLNDVDTENGEPSEIIAIEPNMKGAATCMVKGIKLSTMQEGDKNYITWKNIEGVKNYIVYKSETNPSGLKDMVKVGETSETKFEYPFDKMSKSDIYNYYGVEAVCSDGNNLQIDKIVKVKVGPFDTILFVILLSIFSYLGIKLYSYTK